MPTADLAHFQDVKNTLLMRLNHLQELYEKAELSAHDLVCDSAYAMSLAFEALFETYVLEPTA